MGYGMDLEHASSAAISRTMGNSPAPGCPHPPMSAPSHPLPRAVVVRRLTLTLLGGSSLLVQPGVPQLCPPPPPPLFFRVGERGL